MEYLLHSFSQDLELFPRVQVRLKLQKRNTDAGKAFTLNIRLEKENSRRKSSRAFVPRFPKVEIILLFSASAHDLKFYKKKNSPFLQLKDEAWWLVLGNTSTSELYALKRVSLSNRLVTHMELPSTPTTIQVGKRLVFPYIVSLISLEENNMIKHH